MSAQPRVAFGIPTYNHAHQLERTLESLLSQSFTDMGLVAVDDGSTDATLQILERYAALDPRLRIVRNDQRLGYTLNAWKAYRLSRELFPSSEYFAWGSDHDLWHPHWLQLLSECLDARPNASMAWCWCYRISDEGEIVRVIAKSINRGMSEDRLERVRFAASEAPAGFFLHSLIRVSAMEKTSGLRLVLEPDRLLIAELAAVGPFALVPEFLWYRRYFGMATRARQRRSSFVGGAPAYTYLPITFQHGWILFQAYVVRRLGVPEIGAREGLRITWAYMARRVSGRARRILRRVLGPIWRRARRLRDAESL